MKVSLHMNCSQNLNGAVDWLICLFTSLICISRLVGWLIDLLHEWVFGRLFGWLIDWLIVWMISLQFLFPIQLAFGVFRCSPSGSSFSGVHQAYFSSYNFYHHLTECRRLRNLHSKRSQPVFLIPSRIYRRRHRGENGPYPPRRRTHEPRWRAAPTAAAAAIAPSPRPCPPCRRRCPTTGACPVSRPCRAPHPRTRTWGAAMVAPRHPAPGDDAPVCRRSRLTCIDIG